MTGSGRSKSIEPFSAAAGIQKQRQAFHGAEMVVHVRVARGHFRIAVQHLVHVGVRHALGGADHPRHHHGSEHAPGGIEMHDGAHHQPLFARIQRAHAIGKRFGKHGNGAIDEVDGIAAQARFAIERRFGMHVVRDVGNVHLQQPAAVVAALDVNRVIEIARGFAIDRDDGEFAKILAARSLGFRDRKRQALGFLQNTSVESVRQMMLADDDLGVDTRDRRDGQEFR